MADYTTQHRRKMADPTRITKGKLERGMIAKVRYKKQDGESKDYFVFVLQPNYKKYFHCLNLEYVPVPEIVKLAGEFKEILSLTPNIKKLDLSKLSLEVTSKKFYMNEIKQRPKLKTGYRTFVEKQVTQVTVYNYDYGIFDQIPPEAQRRVEEFKQEQFNRDKNQ